MKVLNVKNNTTFPVQNSNTERHSERKPFVFPLAIINFLSGTLTNIVKKMKQNVKPGFLTDSREKEKKREHENRDNFFLLLSALVLPLLM